MNDTSMGHLRGSVEAAIVNVADWSGKRLQYRPVLGGISNFKITLEDD